MLWIWIKFDEERFLLLNGKKKSKKKSRKKINLSRYSNLNPQATVVVVFPVPKISKASLFSCE